MYVGNYKLLRKYRHVLPTCIRNNSCRGNNIVVNETNEIGKFYKLMLIAFFIGTVSRPGVVMVNVSAKLGECAEGCPKAYCHSILYQRIKYALAI